MRRAAGGQAAAAGLRKRLPRPLAAIERQPDAAYNLLASRQWLLVVPRQFEKWQDVSVNALGYAGSLFVRSPAQIERLRAEGPLAVLRAVGYPR
ncbi:hypothetical protein [Thauera humireducens]|uniref:hypothetical protein n=1 Tax=Thauera humireducens TaxID=1134435 RepID=UPI00311E48D5